MASIGRYYHCNLFAHDIEESRLLSIPSGFYFQVHYNALLESRTGRNHLLYPLDRTRISSSDESTRISAIHAAIVNAMPFAEPRFIADAVHEASTFAFRMASKPCNRNKTVLIMSLFINLIERPRELLNRVLRQSMEGNYLGFKPASKACMDGLERVKVEDSDEVEDCSICLDKHSTGVEVMRLPCKHVFHGYCILQWLQTSHYCPLCRFAFPVDD